MQHIARRLMSYLAGYATVFLLFAGLALAQDPSPSPSPSPLPVIPADWMSTVGIAVLALAPLIGSIATGALRKIVTAVNESGDIPRFALLVLAPSFGILAGKALGWLGDLHGLNPIMMALVGLSTIVLREVVTTFDKHGFGVNNGPKLLKSVSMIFLVGFVALSGAGCGKIKEVNSEDARAKGYATLATVHAGVGFTQDTEMSVRCGVTGAPSAPLCVNKEQHEAFTKILLDVLTAEEEARQVLRLMPSNNDGSIARFYPLIVKIYDLVNKMIGLFPDASLGASVKSSTPVIGASVAATNASLALKNLGKE